MTKPSISCTYQIMKAADLQEKDWAAWEQIRLSRSDLSSPFFHPRFTHVVAGVRDHVEVALLLNGEKSVGFFPFLRDRRNTVQPSVGRLCESQGVIVREGVDWDPEELLRKAGLSAWHFDHMPASHSQLNPYFWEEKVSVFMDLSQGYEAYRTTIKNRGSSLSQVERKSRKLAREVGPLRFELHSEDDAAFQSFIQWKTAQHERTGVLPVLKTPWVYHLLDQLRKVQADDGFGGSLSTLYAGDQLIAVHMGIQNQTALHIWFPTYNVTFDKYSPGLILLLEMAKAGAEIGLQRVDFGREEERYKTNFKTGSVRTAEGAVDLRPISGRLHKQWFATKQWIRASPYREQLEWPLTVSRKLRQRIAFR